MEPVRDDFDRMFPLLEHAVLEVSNSAAREAETDLLGVELAKTRRYLHEITQERGN